MKQEKENITKIKNMFSLEIELIAQPQARIGIGDERGIKHSGIISARNCRRDRETASKKQGKIRKKAKAEGRTGLRCT